MVKKDGITEIGEIIQQSVKQTDNESITVVDLTGLALQDLKIAEAIYLC